MQFKRLEGDYGIEELISLIEKRARNLFITGQLMCSEAVLSVLNQGLHGGLPPEIAVRLASGLPEGLGGTGCTCGALNSGVIAIGLFLGRNKTGLLNSRKIMAVSKKLHDRFKERFGTTCCRILTKNLKRGSKEHFGRCAILTGFAVEMTARLIIDNKPELVAQADWVYLDKRDSKISTRIKQISNTIRFCVTF